MDISIILLLVSVIVIFFLVLIIFKNTNKDKTNEKDINNSINKLNEELIIAKQTINVKEKEIESIKNELKIFEAKMRSFDEMKTSKIQTEERLKSVEIERNNLKNKNIELLEAEETRNNTLRKSIESTNTLQDSLKQEKERLNDERVRKAEERLENMRKQWREHELDVESHIKLICRNFALKYISQEDFPYKRNKPDNSIEIMDQLIVFDAKSPKNDNLSNFTGYIKLQTESLKKYAKHENVKKDLFLVIPSNTLHVIKQFTYNIGDYNVYIITKDALEPIILSLKKIEEYEFADKLSPEERDNICRIIGKFAHTTKRRIQIDQFFANEFLDTLQKARTGLSREILEDVIKFENAEKLNPPMEKRNKKILTQDLIDKTIEISKETEIREIPAVDVSIKERTEKD